LSRRALAALAVSILLVGGIALFVRCATRHQPERASGPTPLGRIEPEALDRLNTVPFYRGFLRPDALRSASIHGPSVEIAVDLPDLLRDRLTRAPIHDAALLLPAAARGVVTFDAAAGADDGLARETWRFDGPSPVLDVIDRRAGTLGGSAIWDAIPASPSAVSGARIVPARLADPSFGGPALAPWRDRAELAERVLGRSLRAEIAEDLAGPVAFALYDGGGGRDASGVLVVELKRSDRLRALLETVFALGALTERASVRRYRDVATGSFSASANGPGIAIAVDGPLLLVATSRFLLESAIDARRGDRRAAGLVGEVRSSRASWTSVTESAFVRRGWHRIARAQPPATVPAVRQRARLTPEGGSSWRLEGEGPAPAVTADPLLPFLYGVFAARQRGEG
jgi:hypothetical protein